MLNIEKLLTTEIHKMNILDSSIKNLKSTQDNMIKASEEITKVDEKVRIYKPVGKM